MILTTILKDATEFLPGTPKSISGTGEEAKNKDKAMAAAIAVSVALGGKAYENVLQRTEAEPTVLSENEPSDARS